MTQPHSKDDVLRMAEWCDSHADLHDWKLSDIADMLRAYTEVVEVDRKHHAEAYVDASGFMKITGHVLSLPEGQYALYAEQFGPPLTAALSTKGG